MGGEVQRQVDICRSKGSIAGTGTDRDLRKQCLATDTALGEALKEVEAQEDEQANGTVESRATGKVETKADVRLGASMDGTMIYIRGEAWKELKVGCIFEVEPAPTLDPETMDWIDLAHARKVTFVSHLGGPEPFGKKMWTELKRRHWHNAIDTQVVGDGAARRPLLSAFVLPV